MRKSLHNKKHDERRLALILKKRLTYRITYWKLTVRICLRSFSCCSSRCIKFLNAYPRLFMGSLPNGVGRYAHACERKLSRKKTIKKTMRECRRESAYALRREASPFTGECINARFPSRLQVPLCARCAPITQKWHHVNLSPCCASPGIFSS